MLFGLFGDDRKDSQEKEETSLFSWLLGDDDHSKERNKDRNSWSGDDFFDFLLLDDDD